MQKVRVSVVLQRPIDGQIIRGIVIRDVAVTRQLKAAVFKLSESDCCPEIRSAPRYSLDFGGTFRRC